VRIKVGLGQAASDAVSFSSLGIERDHDVIGALLGNIGNPVVHAHGPLIDVVGVVAHYLEFKVAIQCNAALCPGINAILTLDQVVGVIVHIPAAAEDVLRTNNGVKSLAWTFFSPCALSVSGIIIDANNNNNVNFFIICLIIISM
jgi:hypothetical protein